VLLWRRGRALNAGFINAQGKGNRSCQCVQVEYVSYGICVYGKIVLEIRAFPHERKEKG
jgi:hypothetical protein